MKTTQKILGFALLVLLASLLAFAVVEVGPTLIASVGWYEIASVGWVGL